MLCHVGLGGHLGRLLGGFFATTATSPELAPLRCLVEGPVSHVVLFCLVVVVGFPTTVSVFCNRCTRRSSAFLLLNAMAREVVFEKKYILNYINTHDNNLCICFLCYISYTPDEKE
jgi:hypothetical protein